MHRISIVLAFPCGRAKTIRIRYVWMRISLKTGKNYKSPFARVDGALVRESESCYCKYESFEKIRYIVMVIELSGGQFGLKSYAHVISKSDERSRH